MPGTSSIGDPFGTSSLVDEDEGESLPVAGDGTSDAETVDTLFGELDDDLIGDPLT